MNTTASPVLAHGDLYDPDDVLPRDSPLLQPLRPILRSPTPSPPPISSPEVSSSPSKRGGRKSSRRMKPKTSRADAILIGYLDGHRQNDIAAFASLEGLASETESHEDTDLIDDSESLDSAVSPGGRGRLGGGQDFDGPGKASPVNGASLNGLDQTEMGVIDFKSLESLATSALAVCTKPDVPLTAAPVPPPTIRQDVVPVQPPMQAAPVMSPVRPAESFRDERPVPIYPAPASSHGTPRDIHSPSALAALPSPSSLDHASPSIISNPTGLSKSLAPIQSLPRHDTNIPTLPSIKAQLGDFRQLDNNFIAEERRRAQTFPRSPPNTSMPPFSSLSNVPGDPPGSPGDIRRVAAASSPGRQAHSPYSHIASSTYNHPSPGQIYQAQHHQLDYTSSSTATPSDHSSTPRSLMAGMSIQDSPYEPQGAYVCKFNGCTAQPFATQYLLNSHANVHSSARPHYCPVKGCPRSEGGKGFKRKNEMIRHGLVHESPGYVCPFCPDREHKYPRPDNLQRHVRVHHVDKDKDDPALREVLSQRPDGPNRGRRRRGGTN
ncbi:hypothetical protein QBC35DRAFT_138602 [Podospora australis]|uniref:C2H2-type domain-containing protein n=1 Tax=Podospora australis TaxID=1536484 RepID=A0AAN6WWA3_9PEZI|nr:hypothetical protein QBC35DRAFT_138602 [Podospora australis]